MSCDLTNAKPRIATRKGQQADLNVDFYNNGQLADPYAIRNIKIYKTLVAPHNLVTTIPVVDPDSVTLAYPAPICREMVTTDTYAVGKYHLLFTVPEDYAAPDVYYDVWEYYPTNPCTTTDPCDLSSSAYASQLQSQCHRFYVYPNEWFTSDDLQTIRFGFEPLDVKFNQPEIRPLEVGIMPLPLYDYNFNLVNPMIPYLRATITISTKNCEIIVDDAPCRIGFRQGSYRSNPYVVKYDINTSAFLKGTYQYQITLTLPDGTSRVSQKFALSIN